MSFAVCTSVTLANRLWLGEHVSVQKKCLDRQVARQLQSHMVCSQLGALSSIRLLPAKCGSLPEVVRTRRAAKQEYEPLLDLHGDSSQSAKGPLIYIL